MTENNFDFAAALLSDAADLVGHAPHGTHIVDDHAYGAPQLVATAESSRQIVLWAADNDRVLAAVEATTNADTDQTSTRIIAFRAAGLMFAGRTDHTFAAHGRHTYVLAATVGADTWQLTVDADTTTLTDSDLDTALSLIARFEHAAYAAG
ncbi:conserved hypothetical protein [uncultured Mycobacterium sp.]|uniref:Uncharacterized protein n=2 Tax=Mycobacteriaceae TaxID=1762 RepID=A0A064C8V8_9MYCO|nr:hypothetical protein [Mycolicibacterium aromaticivorans]KDE97079.1 hypothetical protein Y900_027720 [Mycolicibacterium aromaticivorans JS19b1 = JCM 16368]SBS78078.1 conserved hypothetical protein [uncultured Mycobacterium sp.]